MFSLKAIFFVAALAYANAEAGESMPKAMKVIPGGSKRFQSNIPVDQQSYYPQGATYEQTKQYQQIQSVFGQDPLVQQIVRSPLPNAQLLNIQKISALRDIDGFNSIASRLISNYTVIRPYITEGFSCAGRQYGYYADVDNDCQVFHICFPLRDVFLGDATVPDVTYIFSFICGAGLILDQQSMTCAWQREATPCSAAESLYSMNDAFFKTTTEYPTTGFSRFQ